MEQKTANSNNTSVQGIAGCPLKIVCTCSLKQKMTIQNKYFPTDRVQSAHIPQSSTARSLFEHCLSLRLLPLRRQRFQMALLSCVAEHLRVSFYLQMELYVRLIKELNSSSHPPLNVWNWEWHELNHNIVIILLFSFRFSSSVTYGGLLKCWKKAESKYRSVRPENPLIYSASSADKRESWSCSIIYLWYRSI